MQKDLNIYGDSEIQKMTQYIKVLVTGSKGQLGWELQRTAPGDVQVITVDRDVLDITNKVAIVEFTSSIRPAIIINAAAYTAVDKAEQEPEIAFSINRDGVINLAEASSNIGARLIHVSTDFVFDGRQSKPYLPHDAPSPLGVYGASKLAGEQAAQSVLGENAVILRTAWVYSSHGHNFVKTMLRLMLEREQLGVVSDQIGTPTWANGLATTIWRLVANPRHNGIFHWTDAGVASWYDFAIAIQEEAYNLGLLTRRIPINPISTEAYPTPARRPSYSVLDKSFTWQALGLSPKHWRESLRSMLLEI